jgi:hypothetical protein
MDGHIFEQGWESKGTVCGWGSEIEHTFEIRKELPRLIKKYGVKILNDAGCGDLNWISTIGLRNVNYRGYDLFHYDAWNNNPLKCRTFDITERNMRKADMIICRDVFIHLPNDLVLQTLDHFRQSSSLLLSTSFLDANNMHRMSEPELKYNKINLAIEPFGLGKPLICIEEDYPKKFTCLWRII